MFLNPRDTNLARGTSRDPKGLFRQQRTSMGDPVMSDPHFTDPRMDDPMRRDIERSQRLSEMEQSNAMWGWIAGGVVLALLLVFIFARAPNTSDTASVSNPPATTGSATRTPATPPAAQPRPSPSTTGSSQ